MAVVDPYAPCPCGSGQKYKWCCQKVEPIAEKAERLFEGGQVDAAIKALDDGLKKHPDNLWLSIRKALFLLSEERTEEARPALESLVAAHPSHGGAQTLYVRLLLETEGPFAGVTQLQKAYQSASDEQKPNLAPVFQLVGVVLARTGFPQAARSHLAMAVVLGDDDPSTETALRMIDSDPQMSPWLRNPYRLVDAPESLDPEMRERFAEAVAEADRGLWIKSASAFDALAADGAGAEAERNLAVVRLWLADEIGAAEAIARYVALAGVTDDAVDLEALRQQIAPVSEDDQVDRMQLVWPLRDRAKLLAILENDARTFHQGNGHLDPEDETSPKVEIFRLLDRPRPDTSKPLTPADMPRMAGEVLVGQEIAALIGYDDGSLDALGDRFTALAGPSIAPAHPKTKRVGREERSSLKVNERWLIPPDLDRSAVARLMREDEARLMRDVWAKTPMPFLDGRTPEQAAKAGNAVVPLRAALTILDFGRAGTLIENDELANFRADLGVAPEPPIDPATVDLVTLHYSRLHLVPADRLDDQKLILLYLRARGALLTATIDRAARAILDRPQLLDSDEGIDRITLFSDLANMAIGRGNAAEAHDWIVRGREGDRPESRVTNAPRWDMLEVRLRARTEPPEDWVPQLAIVLDRYKDNPQANESLLMNLIDMGLVRLVPNPDRPEAMYLDSRGLQAVLSRYGPKITTASGGLGISASQGGIWTPEKEAASRGGGGGIWTPGSASASEPPASGDKPGLIITGR